MDNDYSQISLETEDLIIKKAVQEDWRDMYENLWRHSESAKYMLWDVTTSEKDAVARMERTIEFEKKEKYALLVYEKSTGHAIGFAGMREGESGVYEELGIAFGPDYTGKGYGKQALNALVDEAFHNCKANKFIACCRTGNLASHYLQISCGFHFSYNEEKVDSKNGEKYVLEYYVKENCSKSINRRKTSMKTKIGFIGCGWRAHGYMRIIKELGERMEISGVYVHSEKSAKQMEKEYPKRVYTNLDAFMKADHDFVILLVPREHALYYIEELMKHQIPVLAETPPGNGVEELNQCFALKQKYNGKIQVAEQYFLQPYHSGVLKLIGEGRFGEVSNMEIAMIHDYHGLSIMRKVLDAGYMDCTITARAYDFPVQFHCGRDGLVTGSEKIVSDQRKRADFVFDNGKVGFFDFSDEQYFNYFRTRHMNVRGVKGEIYDLDVAYLNESGMPVRGKIRRDDMGQFSNLEGYGLRSLILNGEMVYENPYWMKGVRLSDDEIAMAGLLDGMKRYVDGGAEVYPLEEALQDTYLYLMMDESVKTGRPVRTAPQSWVR